MSEEDFEKKWLTSYRPPGLTPESNESTVPKTRGESILKRPSESRRSTIRQTSASKSVDTKLDEKTKRPSFDSYGKRTSFYVPPMPSEQDKIQGVSADTPQRLSYLDEVSNTLLQPSEMDHRQSTRFSKY